MPKEFGIVFGFTETFFYKIFFGQTKEVVYQALLRKFPIEERFVLGIEFPLEGTTGL